MSSFYILVNTTQSKPVLQNTLPHVINTNCFYNKISNCDWFSAHLFVTYEARNHVDVQLQVTNSQVKYTALMASLALQCFPQFSKLLKNATDVFAQKKFSKTFFNSKFVIDLIK